VVLANTREHETLYKQNRACGLILLGTPHFRVGLEQWAFLVGKHEAIQGWKDVGRREDWTGPFADGVSSIVRAQTEFCDEVAPKIQIACFFSSHTRNRKPVCSNKRAPLVRTSTDLR
jgi:hypothetical protein